MEAAAGSQVCQALTFYSLNSEMTLGHWQRDGAFMELGALALHPLLWKYFAILNTQCGCTSWGPR